MNMIKKILKENFIFILLLILLCISFVMLYNSALFNQIEYFDFKVIEFISNIISNSFTLLFKIITFLGEIYIPLIIIVCIFIKFKNKLYFYLISSSYLLSGLITFILKEIISRPRPLSALINIPSSYSFPSGHTLTSIVFYLTLWYLLSINSSFKKKSLIFIITFPIIILIGLSRIYLGVHYFSDVIGGLLIGITLFMIIINIINKNYKESL